MLLFWPQYLKRKKTRGNVWEIPHSVVSVSSSGSSSFAKTDLMQEILYEEEQKEMTRQKTNIGKQIKEGERASVGFNGNIPNEALKGME